MPDVLYRSPIQMVFPELLLRIFSQCLLSDDFPTCGATAIPVVISQVCANWRRLALDFSQLWSSLRIVISTLHPCPSPSFLQLWLQRGATGPLVLCLELDEFPPVHDMDQVNRARSLLKVLSTRSHFWRGIILLLPGSYDLLQPLSNLVMPRLETLDLTLRNCHAGDFDAIDRLLHNTPSLHSFSWSNRPTWGRWDRAIEGSFLPNSNWQRLTHLVYNSYISLSMLHAILQYSTNLVVCDLRHFGTADTPSATVFQTIYLPHLAKLKVYQEILDHGLDQLLDFLETPALRKLSLTYGRVLDRTSWPQRLFSLLSRSCCELEFLCLEYTGITEEELIQCLWIIHRSLTNLELYDRRGNVCVGDKLLHLLSRREQEELVFCPNLVVLILHGVTRSLDTALIAMLQSQRHGFSCADSTSSVLTKVV